MRAPAWTALKECMIPFTGAISLHLGQWQLQVHPRLWMQRSKPAPPAGSSAECTLRVIKAAPSTRYLDQWIGVSLQVRRVSAAPEASTSGRGMNSSHAQKMKQLQSIGVRHAAHLPLVSSVSYAGLSEEMMKQLQTACSPKQESTADQSTQFRHGCSHP